MKRIATIAAVITTAAVAAPVASGGNVVATAHKLVVSKQVANTQVVKQIAYTQVAKSHRAYALIAMQRHQVQIAQAKRWTLLRAQIR